MGSSEIDRTLFGNNLRYKLLKLQVARCQAALSYAGCRYSSELTLRTRSFELVRSVLAARSKSPAAASTGLIASSLWHRLRLGCAPAVGESLFIVALACSTSACSLHTASSAANLFLVFSLSTLRYAFPQGLNSADLRESRVCPFFAQESRTFRLPQYHYVASDLSVRSMCGSVSSRSRCSRLLSGEAGFRWC